MNSVDGLGGVKYRNGQTRCTMSSRACKLEFADDEMQQNQLKSKLEIVCENGVAVESETPEVECKTTMLRWSWMYSACGLAKSELSTVCRVYRLAVKEGR